ncbi:MAG: hypothetical protein HY057_07055 [Rhodospirillales bacterium]|nr:hypothetical protein [Rhodospirillales bacterium]
MTGRLIGWVLIVAALLAAGQDALGFLRSGTYAMAPLGELWYALHPGSLNVIQAVVERYLHPWLWDPVLFSVVLTPAWIVFAVPGIVLLILFRHGRNRRKWRSGTFD